MQLYFVSVLCASKLKLISSSANGAFKVSEIVKELFMSPPPHGFIWRREDSNPGFLSLSLSYYPIHHKYLVLPYSFVPSLSLHISGFLIGEYSRTEDL